MVGMDGSLERSSFNFFYEKCVMNFRMVGFDGWVVNNPFLSSVVVEFEDGWLGRRFHKGGYVVVGKLDSSFLLYADCRHLKLYMN